MVPTRLGVACAAWLATCASTHAGPDWFGPVTNPSDAATYYVLTTPMQFPQALGFARTNISPNANAAIIRNAAQSDWMLTNLVVPTGNLAGYWIGGQRVDNRHIGYPFVKVIGDEGSGPNLTTRADASPFTNWLAGYPTGVATQTKLIGTPGATQAKWVNEPPGSALRMIVQVDRDCNADAVPDPSQSGPMDTNMISFRGSEDWVNLPDNLIPYDNDDLTIEFWFRTSGNGAILSDTTSPIPLPYATTYVWTIPYAYVGTDGRLRMCLWWGAGTPITTPDPVNDGRWHHAALTIDYTTAGNPAAVAAMYLDGTLVEQRNVTVSSTTQVRHTFLGMWQAGGTWPAIPGAFWWGAQADICELRIWRQARSPAQLSAAMRTSVLGQPLLHAYYRMHTSVDVTSLRLLLEDSSENVNPGTIGGYGSPRFGVNFPTFLPITTDLLEDGVPDSCSTACCLPNLSCQVMTQTACVNASGLPKIDATCTLTSCATACCFSDGSCAVFPPALCQSYSASPRFGETCHIAPCGTNLIQVNPDAEYGTLDGWFFDPGWSIVSDGTQRSGSFAFCANSAQMTTRLTDVDLTRFFSTSYLDSAVTIRTIDWIRAGTGPSWVYSQSRIDNGIGILSQRVFGIRFNPVRLPNSPDYFALVHEYHQGGARRVFIEHGGQTNPCDPPACGPRFDDAFITVIRPPVACCLPTQGCQLLQLAACRVALGTPNAASTCTPSPCCAADFNNIGGVTVQDVFDFLTAWFMGSPTADFNRVGGVTVQDVFDFLTAWFVGC